MRRVAVLLLALLLSACVGIPSSGPVSRVAADDGLGESTVRYVPAGPAEGASPQQIVRGYLDAMLAYPVSTGTATAFLTPDAARSWKSSAGVRVYREPQVSTPGRAGAADDDPVTVSLRLQQDDRLDAQGHRTGGAERAEQKYRLVQVDGEWRISNPQDGMLVSDKFYADYFRQFDLFYLDATGRRLIPDPVRLAVGDQLSTALVASLAGGPSAFLDGVVRTDVPEARDLRSSVTLGGEGIADVAFETDLSQLTAAQQERLSAQIVWTLRQVPDITGVRITGNGIILTPGGVSVQTIGAWGSFGPSSGGRTYALTGERLVSLMGTRVEAVPGPAGADAEGAVDVAVDAGGIAFVRPGRTSIVVTEPDGSSPRQVRGQGLLRPAWDDRRRLWVLDDAEGRTRVRVVDGDAVAAIDARALAGLDIRAFVLSPDTGRYALLTDGDGGMALFVGTVVRDGKDMVKALGRPRRVAPDAAAPSSPVWVSGTTLGFLADGESGRQVYSASIDGSPAQGPPVSGDDPLPDIRATAYVVGDGAEQSHYVVDGDGRLWHLAPGGTWHVLDVDGVRALTESR